jgi:hypothetical protein
VLAQQLDQGLRCQFVRAPFARTVFVAATIVVGRLTHHITSHSSGLLARWQTHDMGNRIADFRNLGHLACGGLTGSGRTLKMTQPLFWLQSATQSLFRIKRKKVSSLKGAHGMHFLNSPIHVAFSSIQ